MAKKQKLWVMFTALLIAAATGLLAWARVGYSVDVMVSDALCQRASVANKNIYIIAIDDKTLEQYGSITSWSRALSADLVRLLNRDAQTKPAVLVFDVIFSEKGDAGGDAAFAEACLEAGNVVTAMSYRFKAQPEYDKNGRMTLNQYHVDGVIMPYEALREATNQGFANTLVGADGYVRRAMAYIDGEEGQRDYSLASQAYQMYQERHGAAVEWPALDENNQYLFSYSGKTGCYSTVSMADIMDGTVNPAIFADGIVFVGAYAVGMQDSYIPAISHGMQMYGVEIQANIVEALLEGKTQQQLPSGIYAAAAVLAAVFYLVVRRMKIIPAAFLTVVCMALNPVFAKVMYTRGYVTPVILLPAVFFLIYAVNLIYGYVQEVMRRQKVVNVFKQYVAPQVVDKISKDKDFELVLGGENRHIACLFVDIRGFTTMSESLRPEEVVEILNEYLSLTTNSIFQNGGTLDKFVGDAAMAVFNAPFDLEDYIYKAVCTARDMKAGADAIAKKFEERFGKRVGFGIGVNCGNAVVGNIGCDFRMDYTAIGDTVNTAARLESSAERGQILISKEVYEAVKDRVEVTPVGEIPLKGKTQGVFVYQLDEVK